MEARPPWLLPAAHQGFSLAYLQIAGGDLWRTGPVPQKIAGRTSDGQVRLAPI